MTPIPRPKLIITGASGYTGRVLCAFFAPTHDLHTVTRQPLDLPGTTNHLWDGQTLESWASAFEGAQAVINLAGRSVNCRYTPENKRQILESRVQTTRLIGQAIAQAKTPPPVWLNSSTATIYRHAEDCPMSEADGELGSGFSVEVAKAWEDALNEAQTPHTRKIALRTTLVLGESGGVLPVMARLVRRGLGGQMGNGRQRFSWIHDHDFCRAVQFLLLNDLSGPVNIGAPQVPTNAEFMAALRRALGVPFGLPATKGMLELGAIFLNTETELVLKSRWIAPQRLLEAGFRFKYPTVDLALADLQGKL